MDYKKTGRIEIFGTNMDRSYGTLSTIRSFFQRIKIRCYNMVYSYGIFKRIARTISFIQLLYSGSNIDKIIIESSSLKIL
jgi:hypothetical protein